MSFKIKLSKFDIEKIRAVIESVKSPMDKASSELTGAATIKEMKNMIGKGISPIEGVGRFPRYKHAGDRESRRYPYNTSQYDNGDKKLSPVNLRLSGDFLDSLEFKTVRSVSGGWGFEVGYNGELSNKKEQGHREGANGQPPRPTIPEASNGEDFAQRIQRVFRDRLSRRLREILRKS